MKKQIIFVAAICSLLILMCGCHPAKDTSSQPASSAPDIVSYIGDSAGASAETETDNTSASDEETDTETDTSDGTDSDTESADTGIDIDTETTIENSDTNEEYTVSAEEVESSLTGYEEEIAGTWNAKYILNDQQNEVDGSIIYGTAYSQYGGVLTLNSDGTFSVRMGASTDDSSTRGTYTYNGGGTLTMQYENDNIEDFERCSLNGEDAISMPVDLFGDIYTVYFMR